MKRNKQEETYKRVRRQIRRNDELHSESRDLEWVPVEEPQFLGWDVQVILGDSGLRRGDVDNILAIMNYFNMSKPTFTRHAWVGKMIRQNNNKYQESLKFISKHIQSKWKGRYGWGYNSFHDYVAKNYMPYFLDTSISESTYENIPLHLKGFFSKCTERATVWRPEYYYYKLSAKFPLYELRLKVTRCYSTHRGIPNSEAQSEYTKMHQKLWRTNLALIMDNYGNTHDAWYHKMQNRVQRKSWNQGLNVLSKRYDHEVSEEVVEHVEKIVSSRASYETW
jgi:hypothetical protein